MAKSKLNILYLSEMMFSFLLLLLMTKKGIAQLYVMSGGFPLFTNFSLMVLLHISFLFIVIQKKEICSDRNRLFGFFSLSVILLFSIFFSVLLNPSEFVFVIELKNMYSIYSLCLMLAFVYIYNMSFKYSNSVIKLIIIFSLIQACLGIFQHYTKILLVPVDDLDGESIVNTIYFLDGISSKNRYFLELGAEVRAFGMTDSGLTLSLFSLLGISLSLVFIQTKLKFVFTFIFLLAVYCSLTRTMWGAIFLFFTFSLFLLRNRVFRLKLLFFFGMFMQAIFILMAYSRYCLYMENIFPTLSSRLEGFTHFISLFNIGLENIFVGYNFSNRIPEFLEISPYSVDNLFLKVFFDIGLISLFIYIYVFYKVILNSSDSRFILSFLVLFSFLNIGNVVDYFYFPIIMLIFLVRKKQFRGV